MLVITNKFIIKNKTFLIYSKNKKKYLKKIYNSRDLDGLKKEIAGYKYFKKEKLFNIPKVISYKLKGRKKNINIEFIHGKKPSIFDIKKVFKKKIFNIKKKKISRYITLMRSYHKENKFFLALNNKYNLNKISKKNIFTSFTHGDFVNYNCLKSHKIIYVYDFEKFGERIYLYDFLNWYLHPIFSKLSTLICNLNFKFFDKIIVFITLRAFNYFVYKLIFKNQIFKIKINYNDFKIYVFLYLLEKITILNKDLTFLKNSQNKKIGKKHLSILKLIIIKIYSEIIN